MHVCFMDFLLKNMVWSSFFWGGGYIVMSIDYYSIKGNLIDKVLGRVGPIMGLLYLLIFYLQKANFMTWAHDLLITL